MPPPAASGEFLILDHHTANNKNLDYFIAKCREWEARCGQAVAMHILPHDAAQRDKVQGLSFPVALPEDGPSFPHCAPHNGYLGSH
ncbi:MAG: hypothetical protein LIO63_03880 [Akkermansia sp.]|nr:hypothetical protein [Akkermansia sp.]